MESWSLAQDALSCGCDYWFYRRLKGRFTRKAKKFEMKVKEKSVKERAVLVGIGLKSESFLDIKEDLVELNQLAEAAGAEVVATTVQQLERWNPATLMGSGKVAEVSDKVRNSEASVVVIDHHLSGVQTRNLESAFGCRVLDRSQLILDIFAQRAQTYEGKLQVELAQLLDQMPRQVGAWLSSLSRQAGGIGTRGPGESALELDRRVIRKKIANIKKRLEEVRKHRALHRESRKKHRTPSFALIGYTNSGKSTLLNCLTESKVLARDQLFATLDPTTRKVLLSPSVEAVVTDTVGFINKLPHHLIEAFKATLEESGEADVLLHIIDLSSPNMERQVAVVEQLIKEFGWQDKPLLHVYNKKDVAPPERLFRITQFPRILVSALTGEGIERLKEVMAQTLHRAPRELEIFFPRGEEHRIYELGREGKIVSKEVGSQGTICRVILEEEDLVHWQPFFSWPS